MSQDVRITRPRNFARGLLLATLLIAPINAAVYFFMVLGARGGRAERESRLGLFLLLALVQIVTGLAGFIAALVYAARMRKAGESMLSAMMIAFFSLLGSGGGLLGGFGGFALLAIGSGGGWGRPLRIRGKVRHPELREGSDWTRGERPNTTGLDAATKAALEALWLHDAQKEHASVPAFARVAWMLAAIGAPAELIERTFRAAQEEIEHTRLCFALAAGYGGRSHSVEPMPELLGAHGLEVKGDALVHLALESLTDGCLLEDYNADVAAACRDACQEPVTGAVLAAIAREERDHAELSWDIVAYCLERSDGEVQAACREALETLHNAERPTAVSREKYLLVSRADAAALRAHGRLPDSEWLALYETRLERTRARLAEMLGLPSPAQITSSRALAS